MGCYEADFFMKRKNDVSNLESLLSLVFQRKTQYAPQLSWDVSRLQPNLATLQEKHFVENNDRMMIQILIHDVFDDKMAIAYLECKQEFDFRKCKQAEEV